MRHPSRVLEVSPLMRHFFCVNDWNLGPSQRSHTCSQEVEACWNWSETVFCLLFDSVLLLADIVWTRRRPQTISFTATIATSFVNPGFNEKKSKFSGFILFSLLL